MEQNRNDEVFCEGRNVEEALQAACDRLNTTPNQVEHEIVESGAAGGVLGFLKGRTFRIRVWKKSEGQRKLTELLKGFFAALDLGVTYEVARADDGYEVNIETEGSDGLLIGRGGETLAALQHLISRMASRADEDLRVRVDVAGYRRRRQDQLRRRARDLADRCLEGGQQMVTEPLPADERRVVHLALAEDPRVETRALGEGLTKRVAVLPTAQATGGSSPGRSTEAVASGSPPRTRGPRPDHERRGEGRGGDEGRSRGSRSSSLRSGSSGRSESRSGTGRGRSAGRSADERRREPRPPADREADGRARHSSGGSTPTEAPSVRPSPREPRPERAGPVPERPMPERPAPEPPVPERPAPERPAPEPPAPEPREEERKDDSYFRIPEQIGLVRPPAKEKSEGEAASEEGEEKPVTFGRRPRAKGRRGR